jgi:CubicO group peptidase (beta-lactamase class C family)
MLLLLACTADEPEDSGEGADTGGDSAADTDSGGDTGDTGAADSRDPAIPWSEDDEAAVYKALKRDISQNSAFNGQIAIWYDGAVVYTASIGNRTVDGEDPIDDQTLFQIGSDTKKIAAIAALQQVAAGKLSLASTVAEAVPGLSLAASPEWAADTTLHELLSHQGGLFDYTPWDDTPDDADLHDRAFGDFAAREWAMAPAGEMWNYANPNFSVAGLMTQTVDGRLWPDIVEEDVFQPLGMTRTFARLSEVLADGDVANSYGLYNYAGDPADVFGETTYDYGEVEPAQVGDNGFTRPAGLVWSTASDQAMLLGFLLDGDASVLDDELRRQMTTAQVPLYPNFPPQSYGYGMFVMEGRSDGEGGWRPLLEYSHGGNTLSYTSASLIYPEQRIAVSILVNAYGADLRRTEAAVLEGMVHPPASTDWPFDLATETDHAQLTGVYEDHAFGRVEITSANDGLHAAFPDLTAAGWDADTDLDYWWADEYGLASGDLRGYDLSFIPDDSGVYRYVRDRLFVGTRADEFARARAAPARPLPSELERYRRSFL